MQVPMASNNFNTFNKFRACREHPFPRNSCLCFYPHFKNSPPFRHNMTSKGKKWVFRKEGNKNRAEQAFTHLIYDSKDNGMNVIGKSQISRHTKTHMCKNLLEDF